MNKSELITAVAENLQESKLKAAAAVNAVPDNIAKALSEGKEIRILGFGTFRITALEEKEGRNPRTGAPIKIAAKKNPKFVAGKELKDRVNA